MTYLRCLILLIQLTTVTVLLYLGIGGHTALFLILSGAVWIGCPLIMRATPGPSGPAGRHAIPYNIVLFVYMALGVIPAFLAYFYVHLNNWLIPPILIVGFGGFFLMPKDSDGPRKTQTRGGPTTARRIFVKVARAVRSTPRATSTKS